MELSIGRNIKLLRQKRELTQEEVATHLGISFQSISKWERGDGYPDITMLPILANYFDVTVDELIGADDYSKGKKYDEINEIWAKNNINGLHLENIVLMKKSLKMFPNDSLLLVQLSTSLEKAGETVEERAHNLRESIAVQEQIIKYGDDSEVRGATLYNICFSYQKNGENDKALDQAKKLPNLYKGRENALICFVDGEEKRRIAHEALTPLAWSVAHHMKALAETESNSEWITKASRIIDIMFGEEKEDFIKSIQNDLQNRLNSDLTVGYM